jgi:hypothetical protein
MRSDNMPGADSFVLPAQTIRGSRNEMLATIDQSIVGLLALRHLVAGESLVMPNVTEPHVDKSGRHTVPTSLAEVGRIFSSLMRRHN